MKLKYLVLTLTCLIFNQTRASIHSPLGDAIWSGNFTKVQELIDSEQDINNASAMVFEYASPLTTAVDVLNQNNNPGATDADNKNIRLIIRYLVEKKVPLNKKDATMDARPIHLAARRGENEFLKLFIDNGADINIKGYLGKTALHEAIEQANYEGAKILLEVGADTSIQNDQKLTPYELLLEKISEGINPDVGIPLKAQEETLLNLKKIKQLFDTRTIGQGFKKIGSSQFGKISTNVGFKFE